MFVNLRLAQLLRQKMSSELIWTVNEDGSLDSDSRAEEAVPHPGHEYIPTPNTDVNHEMTKYFAFHLMT